MGNSKRPRMNAQRRKEFADLFEGMEARMTRQKKVIDRMIVKFGNTTGNLRVIADLRSEDMTPAELRRAVDDAAARAAATLADLESLTAEEGSGTEESKEG